MGNRDDSSAFFQGVKVSGDPIPSVYLLGFWFSITCDKPPQNST
jgi:hypothetical protein